MKVLVFAHKSKYFDAYKISSSNIYENRIYQYILKNNLPFIINISGLKIFELNKIYKKIKNKDFCMMIGFQNFPTKVEDINLNKISFLKNKFNDVCVGYADHTDSKIDILPISIPMMALAKGANVIEKHININRSKKKNDYFSSLDPKEFHLFISSIKKGNLSQGSKNFNILKSEIQYLNFAKKYMVASRNLPKGQLISDKDINFKRTNQKGIDENDFKSLKKIRLNKAIKADSIIKKMILKNKSKTLLLIAVRLKSKRLKNKALLTLQDNPLILTLHNRLKKVNNVSKIIWCTSTNKQDDPIYKLAKKNNIDCIRGSELNVISRFLKAINLYKARDIVRVTGDNP